MVSIETGRECLSPTRKRWILYCKHEMFVK